ncbi:MAG: hypothetical protein Q7S81_00350 [bacterium]|nr:hypothetical protein [bacterium]
MNKFYKNLLKHNWLYISGILILAVLLFVLKINMQSSVAKISSQHSILATRSNSLLSLATLKGEFIKANPYFSLLENILPPRDQLLSFSKELEGIARKNNLEFNFNFGEEKLSSGTNPGQISFRAIVNGSYDGVSDFLKGVETSKYFIDPSSVDLVKKGAGFSATINGKVFFR